MRMFWFLEFRVLALMQWSAMVSAFSQTSTLFKVYSAGQTPVAGMQLLAKLTVSSVFECGRLCWNNGDNAGCGGFLYQTQLCDEKSQSPSQSAGCQLLQFPDVNSLSFQPANTSCPWQFYVSTLAASQSLFPSIVGNISGKVPIWGLTASSDGQLFVTREPKTSSQVSVYDTTTLKLVRYITVVGATGILTGLLVSSDNSYLYIADHTNWSLFKVNLSSSSTVANWTVAQGPNALSMNSKQNILVANDLLKIQEYTQNGSLVRQTTTISATYHAVEGSNDLLAVSFNIKNRVSLMTVNGSVLYTFNGTSGLSFNPRCLGVDKQGYVLVADRASNRVLVLNPTLTVAQPFRLTGNATVEISNPIALWLDSSAGLLYVGEAANRYRVLVFDVSHVSSLFDTP